MDAVPRRGDAAFGDGVRSGTRRANEFDLRWFSPAVEVDLCGHATLASAHVLFETGRLAPDATARFHTRSGELRATWAGAEGVTLDFPVAVPVPEPPMPALFDALGLPEGELLRTDGEFFLCPVADAAIVRALHSRLRRAARARRTCAASTSSAPGDDGYDIVSRCFAPAVGIDEDPVTGSMHCVLVAYWGPKLHKDELHAYQASTRGGEVTVVRKGDRALLTGRATTVLAGELRVTSSGA